MGTSNTRMRTISDALLVFHTKARPSGEIVRAVWGALPRSGALETCEFRGAVVDVRGGPWHL